LTSFPDLEELNLESAILLAGISGLAGFPIKNLNLECCDNLKSIAPVRELRALETLNIKDCESINDLEAIDQHPSLKVLTVSEALKKKWGLKERFKNMPSLNIVTSDLSSEEAAIIEEIMIKFGLGSDKNKRPNNVEKPVDTIIEKKKFTDAAYNKLKAALSEINKDIKKDIYALSFYFNDKEDLRYPLILVSYNTITNYKEKIPKASDDKEAKWNFAFWPQNFIEQIGGGNDELLKKWFENTVYYYSQKEHIDAFETDNEEAFEDCLEKGNDFCCDFLEEIISMTKQLFDDAVIKAAFGKNIPILIHELEYYDDTLDWSLKSNPQGLVDEFSEWVKSLDKN